MEIANVLDVHKLSIYISSLKATRKTVAFDAVCT